MMQIEVNGLAGFVCQFQAESTCTLAQVKEAICERTGIPKVEQSLLIGTQQIHCEAAWKTAAGGASPDLPFKLSLVRFKGEAALLLDQLEEHQAAIKELVAKRKELEKALEGFEENKMALLKQRVGDSIRGLDISQDQFGRMSDWSIRRLREQIVQTQLRMQIEHFDLQAERSTVKELQAWQKTVSRMEEAKVLWDAGAPEEQPVRNEADRVNDDLTQRRTEMRKVRAALLKLKVSLPDSAEDWWGGEDYDYDPTENCQCAMCQEFRGELTDLVEQEQMVATRATFKEAAANKFLKDGRKDRPRKEAARARRARRSLR